MAKIRREDAITAALALLDEVGLDAFSTRRLAQRLGVESASLYWHFADKAALLAEMASAALARHHTLAVPDELAAWPEWYASNARSIRRALLANRDGARLHAGTTPDPGQVDRILPKVDYLVRAGFPREHAMMALLTASQFTVGCVMEQQARPADAALDRMTGGAEAAFEFGLGLLVDGLRRRLRTDTYIRR